MNITTKLPYINNKLNNYKFIIKSSFIVTVTSFIANIFSYLFQLLAGKYFSKSDFGILTSLFALSGIIAMSVSFLTNGIAKLVSEIKDDNYPNRISQFFYSLLKINIIISFAVIVILILASKNIANYLKISDIKLLIIFSFAIGAGILASPFNPFLQGLQRFKAVALYTLSTTFTKFLVIIIIMYSSLKLINVFEGLTIATLVVSVFGFFLLKKNINFNLRKFNNADVNLLIKYSFGGVFTLLGLNLFPNADIILVKHFFIPDIAGVYASLSILGKIIYYASAPVGLVILPICAESYKKRKEYVKPFYLGLIITILISLFVAFIFTLFPEYVINVLFGKKYLNSSIYLPYFSMFMVIYSINYLFGLFFISISKFKVGALTIVGAIVQIIGISFINNSLFNVIIVSICASILLLILFLASFYSTVIKQ